jgi:hypothetical protein
LERSYSKKEVGKVLGVTTHNKTDEKVLAEYQRKR